VSIGFHDWGFPSEPGGCEKCGGAPGPLQPDTHDEKIDF